MTPLFALRPWLPEDSMIIGSILLTLVILLKVRRGKSGLAIGGIAGILLGFLVSLAVTYPYEVVNCIYGGLLMGIIFGIAVHELVRLYRYDKRE